MKTLQSKMLVALAVALCALATGCSDSSSPNTVDPVITDITTIITDEIPGFGVSEKNAMRDDKIALWEAYQREALVKKCMNDAGQSYEIEVAFPVGVALDVADTLDLPDAHGIATVGSLAGVKEENFTRARSLSVGAQEHYFQALYEETAADIELVESTGELPPGRADFARGGCFGAAWAAIPGVYSLKRNLAADIVESRNNELKKSRSADAECSAKFGDALSMLSQIEQSNERSGNEVGEQCIAELRILTKVATEEGLKRVLVNNESLTRAHQQSYENVSATIASDTHFLAFMASSTHGVELDTLLDNAEDLDE